MTISERKFMLLNWIMLPLSSILLDNDYYKVGDLAKEKIYVINNMSKVR